MAFVMLKKDLSWKGQPRLKGDPIWCANPQERSVLIVRELARNIGTEGQRASLPVEEVAELVTRLGGNPYTTEVQPVEETDETPTTGGKKKNNTPTQAAEPVLKEKSVLLQELTALLEANTPVQS